MREVIGRDHTVLCLSPPASSRELRAFGEIGVLHQRFDPQSSKLPFLARRHAAQSILDQLRDWRPDAILAASSDVALDAALGARSSGAKRFVVLCNDMDAISTVPAKPNAKLDRRVLEQASAFIAHNASAAKVIRASGQLPVHGTLEHVPGEGVELEDNPAQPLPDLSAGIKFLMIAETNQHAEISNYIAAANSVAQRYPQTKFSLSLAPWAVLDGISGLGAVQFLGHVEPLRPALAACHVPVHLSADDGLPPTLLAALAAGRPVLSLDLPGCRDTVDEGVNGCLIPARDPAALAPAMESFVIRSELIPSQGRASRLKAERWFDARLAMSKMLGLLDLA